MQSPHRQGHSVPPEENLSPGYSRDNAIRLLRELKPAGIFEIAGLPRPAFSPISFLASGAFLH